MRVANPALPGLRAADPQGRAEMPLLRHLVRVERAVDFGGLVLPLSRITLMHPTEVPRSGRQESWVYEE